MFHGRSRYKRPAFFLRLKNPFHDLAVGLSRGTKPELETRKEKAQQRHQRLFGLLLSIFWLGGTPVPLSAPLGEVPPQPICYVYLGIENRQVLLLSVVRCLLSNAIFFLPTQGLSTSESGCFATDNVQRTTDYGLRTIDDVLLVENHSDNSGRGNFTIADLDQAST